MKKKAGAKKRPAPAAQAPTGKWLVKTEPSVYGWDRMVADRRTCWDGVRNHLARNHLAAMKAGDEALFYHADEERSAVGLVRVVREAYPDPSADDPRWVMVDVEPVAGLARPVPLATIKADRSLAGIPLVRMARLSVMPLPAAAFERIVELGGGRTGL